MDIQQYDCKALSVPPYIGLFKGWHYSRYSYVLTELAGQYSYRDVWHSNIFFGIKCNPANDG